MEVVCDGQAEEVATNGKQRWPLSPSTTLRLSMSQPSTEASSDKVPGWGSPPHRSGEPEASLESRQARPELSHRNRMHHTCHFPCPRSHVKGEKDTDGLNCNNIFYLTAYTKILSFRHDSNIENMDEVAYTLLLYHV